MARQIGFFVAGGPVGESVGDRDFQTSKGGLTMKKIVSPISGSHGHPRGENRGFSYFFVVYICNIPLTYSVVATEGAGCLETCAVGCWAASLGPGSRTAGVHTNQC